MGEGGGGKERAKPNKVASHALTFALSLRESSRDWSVITLARFEGDLFGVEATREAMSASEILSNIPSLPETTTSPSTNWTVSVVASLGRSGETSPSWNGQSK